MTKLNAFPPNPDALDLLFAQRNKAYGAYDLRRHYDRNVRKATAITLLLCCCFVATAFWGREAPAVGKKYASRAIKIADPIVIEKPKPKVDKPIAMPKQANVAQSRYQPVKPVEDHKILEETPLEAPKYNAGNYDIAPSDTSGTSTAAIDIGTADAPSLTPPPEPKPAPKPAPEPEPQPQDPVLIAEQMPEFVGGIKAMMEYVQKNVQYPNMARDNGIEGTVALRFVVNENGNISDIELLRGIGSGCDQEAVRVVQSMPTWKPGKQNGKAVKVYFTLPIKFKLE